MARRIMFLVWLLAGMVWGVAYGQTQYFWRNDQNPPANANWANGSPIYWWRGFAEIPTGGDILSFDGNSANMISVNNLAATNRYRITFENTNSPGSRILNGATTNTFFDFGGNVPAIINNSGVTHTINFPILNGNSTGTNRFEINANNGNLNIGSTLAGSGGTRNLVAMGASNSTFSGVISDGSSTLNFIKEGTGTSFLTGSNNYTGSTTVSSGVLNIQNTTATGTIAGGVSVTSGAAFQIQGGIAIGTEALTLNGTGIGNTGALRNISGNNSWAGAVTLGSASRINSDAGTLTISGAISGAGLGFTIGGAGNHVISGAVLTGTGGTLNKDGAGTLIASGLSDFTGITTISGGTFNLGSAGTASPSRSPLGTSNQRTVVNNGAVLDLNGYSLAPSEDLTLNGTGISNNGALVNLNATTADWRGVLTLGSNSSIIANNGGINLINTGSAGGSGAFTLTLGGSSGGSLAHNCLLAGSIGAITKEGTGTWVLSGVSTYTGATTINAGTLQISGGNNRLPSATAVTLANTAGAVLDINNLSQQIGSLSGGGTIGGNVTLGTGTLTVGNASNTTFSGNMSGTNGNLIKVGTGTLVLSGTNSYTGSTTISAGRLEYNTTSAMSIGDVILSGGTLGIGTAPAGTFNAGNFSQSGSSTIDLGSGSNAFTINFANYGGTFTGNLTINNWTPTAGKHIVIPNLTASELALINFANYGSGAKYDLTATNRIIPAFLYETVASGANDFSNSASWKNGIPPVVACGANSPIVIINSGFTLNQNIDVTLARVENYGTFNSSNNNTITLCPGATFLNNGVVNFTAGTGGAIVCSGTTTFSGTASSANFAVNNLTLNGAATLTSVPTIRGTLQLNSGGTVSAAPLYTNTSTLVYNQTGTVSVLSEWTGNSTTAGTGIPQQVSIQNNTTVNFPTTNRGCAGHFLISSGNAVLNAISGDLYVGGNFTNSGTFTHNNRALFLNGTTDQSLNGTLNATGANNCFPFLLISKSGGTVSLNAAVNVTNTLTLTSGTITLGLNNLTITSGTAIAGTLFGATKMIITNSTGALVFGADNTGTYLFPVGETTNYTPITVNISSSEGTSRTLGMRVVDGAVPATPLNIPTAPADYITRYWIPSSSGFTAISWTGSLQYAASGDEVGTPANLRLNVWLPASENTWQELSGSTTAPVITGSGSISGINTITSSGYITGRSVAPKLYYRSNSITMNWSAAASWETSPVADFSSGLAAGLVPPSASNSSGITIRTGHSITVDTDATLDQAIVETGASIIKSAGAVLTINDGTGEDLDVYGTFAHNGGITAVPTGTAAMRIRTNATLEVNTNSAGSSSYGTSNRIWYEDAATLYWKENAATAFSTSTTYFPNSPDGIIPIFRFGTGSNITLNVGANTFINGILQVDATRTLTWNQAGITTIRNGILGTGNVTQGVNNLGFVINGTTSQLGGTGSLTLNTAGLSISAGTCTLVSDKIINATSGIGAISVASGATLNTQTNAITGTSIFTLSSGGTLGIGSANGITTSPTASGNIQTSTRNFNTGGNYTYNGTADQETGNGLPSNVTITGTVTIANTGTALNNIVTLTNNSSTSPLTRLRNLSLAAGRLAIGNTGMLYMEGLTTGPVYASITGSGGNVVAGTTGGTIFFSGPGTVNSATNGWPSIYNMILQDNGTGLGVDFISNATITGSLTINSQGFVNPNAPTFASSSTLIYNNGGSYNRSVEWGQAIPGAPGYPHHVTVQNGTTVNLALPSTPPSLEIGGNLTIGTALGSGIVNMNAATTDLIVNGSLIIGASGMTGSELNLSTVFGADLLLFGDFTRWENNFYNENTRAVFFRGNTNAEIRVLPPIAATPGAYPPRQVFVYPFIEKTGGAGISLRSHVGVSTQLNLISGFINTSESEMLVILNTATNAIVGGIATSYINGPMVRRTSTASPGTYMYPIGKTATAKYRPLQFTTVGNLASSNEFKAEFFSSFNATPELGNDNIFLSTILHGIMKDDYWQFDRTIPGTTTGKVAIYYVNPGPNLWRDDAGNTLNPCPDCNVAVVKRTSTTGAGDWEFTRPDLNFDIYSPVREAITPSETDYIISGTLSTFSPFTVGFGYNNILGSLPVKLLSFDGKLQNGDAHLQWSIDSDKDLLSFEVQHSTNGVQFAKVGALKPAGKNYSFVHSKLPAGKHFYRLLVKEKAGAFYSKTIVLMVGNGGTFITGLQTTVVQQQVVANVYSATNQKVEATITDMSGKLISKQSGQLLQGQNQLSVPVALLAKGLYHITLVTSDGVRETLRWMKE